MLCRAPHWAAAAAAVTAARVASAAAGPWASGRPMWEYKLLYSLPTVYSEQAAKDARDAFVALQRRSLLELG